MKQKPITTKQLIAKLLELDPEGNKQVSIIVPQDGYSYDGYLYENNVKRDNIGRKNIISFYTPW